MKLFNLNERFKWLYLILFILNFTWLKAQQSIYLKIQAEDFQPINLVVSPFRSEIPTDITSQVRKIFINDLTLSGFFTIIDNTLTNNPLWEYSFMSGDSSRPQAAAQVEAHLVFEEDIISLWVKLQDLPSQKVIFQKAYTTTLSGLRWLAHAVADEVVYYLVGEPGVACTRLTFVTDFAQAKELALVDYDGHGLKQLTANGSINLSPAWSPNGELLAFTHFKDDNPNLMLFDLDERRMVSASTERGLNTAPAWSPDGKKIALTLSRDGNPEIYTLDVKRSKLTRLTNHPAIDSSPTWSPNGRIIAFTSDRSGTPQIYLMDAEGGNVRRLTFEGNYNDSPTWSPKSERLAHVSRIDGYFHIFTIDVTGENRQQLTTGSYQNEDPCWAPDGFRLAFASNRQGQWDIYVMNWDGTQLRRVTTSGGNRAPAWSPRLVEIK